MFIWAYTMRIARTGKPSNFYYYIIEDYRNREGKKKTRTVEALGCASVIRKRYKVSDADLWCKNYVAQKNLELKAQKMHESRELIIKLQENLPKQQNSCIFNAGYLILDSVYHSFGINNICFEIMLQHPHVGSFDLNNVLRTMLFGRVLFPSSKLNLTKTHQHRLLEDHNFDVWHIYRAMDLLNSNNALIQNRLYHYSLENYKRDVAHIYYDCTNFYTEKELEDCDRNMPDKWQKERTLRKYGKSKEHRPNPIVQMGLFMDGNGMPLGFCINPGNTNEQITMIPLERELTKSFKKADIIVCTDNGLASEENRRFNTRSLKDPLVRAGLRGQRRYICTKSVKQFKSHLEQWALDKTEWSYVTRGSSRRIITGFDLRTLDDPAVYKEHYNTIFFKERTTAENGLDERLIVTFSLKYLEYLREIRDRKIERAKKMILSGTYDKESDYSPKSYIDKQYTLESGEPAKIKTAHINEDKIKNDERYDGFYALVTNIFKEEKPLEEIIAISSRRWEIEECFRIMKSDLEARPFYHSKDQRIIAHFQTCFMALLLLRGIEYKLAEHRGKREKFPNGKYSIGEILETLRNLNVIAVNSGQGYQPDYNNSELTSDLLSAFCLNKLENQVVTQNTMKNIMKEVKRSPRMYKH